MDSSKSVKRPFITFLGHSGFSIECKESLVLVDAWLSRNGAFDGTWKQVPANHYLFEKYQNRVNNEFAGSSYIIITHAHEDHFDTDFLAALRNCKFLIPCFENKSFRSLVLEVAHHTVSVEELEDCRPFKIESGIDVVAIIDDNGIDEDSAIYFSTPYFNFLNQNDCKAFDKSLEFLRAKSIDILACQYASASAHPIAYLYSLEEKKTISLKKAEEKFTLIKDFAKKLDAGTTILCGGPAAYPELQATSDYYIDQILYSDEAIKNVWAPDFESNKLLIPRIEQRVDISTTEGLSFSDIQKSLRAENTVARNRVRDSEMTDEEVRLVRINFIDEVLERIRILNNHNATAKWVLSYKCTDSESFEEIVIDFEQLTVYTSGKELMTGADMQRIVYSAPVSTYIALANKATRWQDIHLSFRFSIKRFPDSYSPLIHAFMLSEPRGLDTFVRKQKMLTYKIEKIRVTDQAQDYLVDRYCPHNGADLSKGIMMEGKIVCPRHGWCFDIRNNGRCDRSHARLDVKKIH